MLRRRRHPEASVSARRTEAYTDGVFAIAATLLVLGLTDQTFTDIGTDADLAAALRGLWHPIFTFAIGFLILGTMWMAHVRQFEYIARIDDVGMWINTLRLLFIVLVPFTSSLNTEYADLLLGRVLLPITFFIAILLGWMQWLWAVRSGAIPGLAPAEARRVGRAALSAVLISGVVVAASPWLGSVAFVLFLLDGPLTSLLRGGDPEPVEGDPEPAGGVGEGRG